MTEQMPQPEQAIIFTDLDGSLLDHESYSWQAASNALNEIRHRNIPLIICSSKTCSEIQELCQKLDIYHPFIFENGCGVAVPRDYFCADFRHEGRADYEFHYLGDKLPVIHETLAKVNTQGQYRYELFSQIPAERIALVTGLSPGQAGLAARRQCSEPLLWHDSESALSAFREKLQKQGLSISRGGRFHSVTGGSNKGRAVKWLLAEYKKHAQNAVFVSLALGDGENDIDMFRAVDHASLINNPHIEQTRLQGFCGLGKTGLVGPAGWNRAVLDFIALQINEI